jgi:hypothetical protein
MHIAFYTDQTAVIYKQKHKQCKKSSLLSVLSIPLVSTLFASRLGSNYTDKPKVENLNFSPELVDLRETPQQ